MFLRCIATNVCRAQPPPLSRLWHPCLGLTPASTRFSSPISHQQLWAVQRDLSTDAYVGDRSVAPIEWPEWGKSRAEWRH
jgi:hypothetical protein